MLCVPKKEKTMKLKERAKKLKTDIPALVAITVRLIPKAHGSISLLWQRRWHGEAVTEDWE